MNIFGNVEPPAWLRDIARPADAVRLGQVIGTSLSEVATALQRDPNSPEGASWLDSRKGLTEAIAEVRANKNDQFWKLKTAAMQNNIAAQQAHTTSSLALANERFRESAAWMEDAPKLSKWATATPEERATMETPGVTSKTAMGIIQKTQATDARYSVSKQAAENQSVDAKQRVQENANFLKRLGSLEDAVAREQIRQMKNPAQKLQALALAEEAQKVRKENESNQARIEAEARGEVPTTTVGPKGVTQTYKPSVAMGGPTEFTASTGQKFLTMPGSKALWQLKDSKKEMEAKVALEDWRQDNISLHAALKSTDKASIKLWQERADKKLAALRQFYKPTDTVPAAISPPAPATNAPAAPGKKLTYNPATDTFE